MLFMASITQIQQIDEHSMMTVVEFHSEGGEIQ